MRGLQILAALLLLVAFCKSDKSSEEVAEEIRTMLKECAEENDLTKDDIEEIPRMICAGEALDQKRSCHTACFYKKLGMIEKGDFLTDEVKKSILFQMKNENERKEIEGKLSECKEKVAGTEDECNKAVEFTRCLLANTDHCEKL